MAKPSILPTILIIRLVAGNPVIPLEGDESCIFEVSMPPDSNHNADFLHWKCCVLLPTYNNAGTLRTVLKEVLEYTDQVLVVNDGSTDDTSAILDEFPTIDRLDFGKNQGKGVALKEGFRKASESGYRQVITMDSDGQHLAKDLPVFLKKLEEEPGSVIVGARNMNQENVPGGSSFGNKFSNFWYKVETGITLPDTQSGYRLYPLYPLSEMRYYSGKYEFEIEVLVRAAWKGLPVTSVPVDVHYDPEEERISHFRPRMDFFRISLLNTVLVILAFLFFRPLMFWHWVRKKNFRGLIKEQFLNPEESNRKKSLSVALGIFMGIVPIWGYQLASAIALAYILRLNKMIVIVTAQISIPPMIPVIIYGSYLTGGLFLDGSTGSIAYDSDLGFEQMGEHLYQYVIGSLVLAVVLSLCLGCITYLLLSVFRRRNSA